MPRNASHKPRYLAHWPLAVFAAVLLALIAVPSFASRPAHFTRHQVEAGKQVYSAHCSQCHGARLQGGAGPALAGKKFESSLEYAKYSASGLYDFISTYMPKTSPGSLGQDMYLDVYAFILSKNGFVPGGAPLDKESLSKIKLLPLPHGGNG